MYKRQLQNGAVKVYSVDVGHGQLAWKLRNDERVVCMEKTNIRYVTHENIPDEMCIRERECFLRNIKRRQKSVEGKGRKQKSFGVDEQRLRCRKGQKAVIMAGLRRFGCT